MAEPIAIASRRTGRGLAATGALLLLAWSGYAAVTQSMPEWHVYDGYWMLGGGTAGFALAALLARHWRRERALPVVGLLTLAGAWAPLALLALRAGVPVLARFKGAWVLTGADVVGLALPVAAILAWLALREHRPAGDRTPS
jgi:hypothetical protein